jgi:putative transposase
MELYHALNRGVDGRLIFHDSQDYARFVHDLYEFNDTAPAPEFSRRDGTNVGHRMSNIRERLVDLHGWCLMKNHYHLLLSERVDGGLSLFLRKLNVGYARYFNERHKRKGFLLQGRTKKILIERHAHFLYILHYIHLNPLDYLPEVKEWRIRNQNYISNVSKALKYLNSYRWSSLLDYCGTKNFPSLITTKLFADEFEDYKKTLIAYLTESSENLPENLRLE